MPSSSSQQPRALYGCVQSALLWYNMFVGSLEQMGFSINPYDPCVANATIDGKQCTIVWYVDDMKVSHVDPTVVDSIIAKVEAEYGEMTKMRGKAHEFLGMHITFLQDKKVRVNMRRYLDRLGIDVEGGCVVSDSR